MGKRRSSGGKRRRDSDQQTDQPAPKRQAVEVNKIDHDQNDQVQNVNSDQMVLVNNSTSQSISLQEILRSLKDSTKSNSEKIEIAKTVLNSATNWDSYKELLYIQLLQWISYNITSTFKNTKKEKFYLEEDVWKLVNTIESHYLQPLLSIDLIDESKIPQETKLPSQNLLAFGEFILISLKNQTIESNFDIIYNLCELLLGLQWFKPAITIEQYSNFLITILTPLETENNKELEKQEENYFKILCFSMESFINYLDQLSNHKKVFSVIINKLIDKFLLIQSNLEQKNNENSITNNLKINIQKCIKNVLFTSTDCSHYGNDKQLVSYHHQLFSKLKELSNKNGEILKSFPFLLENYILCSREQINTGSTITFHESDFFIQLFSILIDILNEENDQMRNDDKNLNFPILFHTNEELFTILIKYIVNIPNQENINEKFDLFTSSVIETISKENHDLQWKCFTLLLDIEHNIILKYLDEKLYPLLILYPLHTNQTDFLIGLMKLYSKLHQSEKFINGFFKYLFTQNNQFFNFLHSHTNFWIHLAEFCNLLSPHKEFEIIWELFISQYLLLNKNESEFDILSEIFIIFLDNIKITENNAIKIKELIDKTCKEILYPIITKLGIINDNKKVNKKEKSQQQNAQYVVSSFGVYSCLCTLHNHCESLLFKSYHSNILQTGFLKPESYFSLLFKIQNEEENKNKKMEALQVFDVMDLYKEKIQKYPKILFSFTMIGVQRIYELHSCSVSIIDDISKELQLLTNLIMNQCIYCWNQSRKNILHQTWNRNPHNITNDNIAISLFYIIFQNLFFLSQYFSTEHMQQFLHFIFDPKLLQNAFQINENHDCKDLKEQKQITFGFLLQKLCENDQFYELHLLRSQIPFTFKSLLNQQIVKYLNLNSRNDKSSSNYKSSIVDLLKNLSINQDNSLSIHFKTYLEKNNNLKSMHFEILEKNHQKQEKIIKNLLYLLSFLNAFPNFYLTENHWFEILPFIYIIEEILYLQIKNEKFTNSLLYSQLFRLIFECRNCFIKSTKNSRKLSIKSNDSNNNNKILQFFQLSLQRIFIHSCYFINQMDFNMKNVFNSFNRKIFIGICSLSLHNNNYQFNVLYLFQFEQLDELKLFKRSSILLSFYLDWLLAWLKCMKNISCEKENSCILQTKKIRMKQQIRKIQQSQQKIIETNLSNDTDDQDSDSDSDSESESNENEKENKKEEKSADISFEIPTSWLEIENEIFNQIQKICSRSKELLSSNEQENEKISFINHCFDIFGNFIEFHKIFYSKYINTTKFTQNIQKFQEISLLFDFSIQILNKNKIKKEENEKLPKFMNDLYDLINSLDISCFDKLSPNSMFFLTCICGCLHLPICENVKNDKILFLVDKIQYLLTLEYQNYNLSFSPSFHFNDCLEMITNPSKDNTFISKLLEIYILIVKTCSTSLLKKILIKNQIYLNSINKIDNLIGIMCLYQCFSCSTSK